MIRMLPFNVSDNYLHPSYSADSFAERLIAYTAIEGIFFSGRYSLIVSALLNHLFSFILYIALTCTLHPYCSASAPSSG